VVGAQRPQGMGIRILATGLPLVKVIRRERAGQPPRVAG